MTEPPAGPLAARFEMMMAELLARQAATLAGSDEPERASPPATLPGQVSPTGTDETPPAPPSTLPGRTATAPRPADLGLPRAIPAPVGSPGEFVGGSFTVGIGRPAAAPAGSERGEIPSVLRSRGRAEDAAVQDRDAGTGRPARDPLAGPRARMILEIGRTGGDTDPKFATRDSASTTPVRSAVTPKDLSETETSNSGRAGAGATRDDSDPATRVKENDELVRSDASGPEPEASIASGRAAAELGRLRPSASPALPQIDPAGLALDLALLVNAEMHKGWPGTRYVPLLERPRPPAEAIERDEEESSEDEGAESEEGDERSAGYEAMLAYIGEHAASRRLKRTLLFAIGCYCALLNTLATEILEYFADEVDEGIERNHDRA